MSLPSRSRQRCARVADSASRGSGRADSSSLAPPSPEACGRPSVGDRVCEGLGHTTPPEFGEGEPAASSPLPLRHHFGHPAETRCGLPCDFQEGREVLWPPARATTCP